MFGRLTFVALFIMMAIVSTMVLFALVTQGFSLRDFGAFGDSFNVLTPFCSSAAVLAAVVTVVLQHRQMLQQTRSAQADSLRLQVFECFRLIEAEKDAVRATQGSRSLAGADAIAHLHEQLQLETKHIRSEGNRRRIIPKAPADDRLDNAVGQLGASIDAILLASDVIERLRSLEPDHAGHLNKMLLSVAGADTMDIYVAHYQELRGEVPAFAAVRYTPASLAAIGIAEDSLEASF